MIVVDFNQVVISNLFMYAKQNADQVEVNQVRSMVLMSLKRYNKKFRESFGDMVICVDGRNVWRKETFPYYKANRKKSKQSDDMDWDFIHSTIYQIAEELYYNFPYKVLNIDRAESDDIIAVLCKRFHTQEKIMVVSGDKDLIQLQRYPGVKQYDPVRDRFLTTDNPDRFLTEHIIRGDAGDGVPNFLSDDDTFVNSEKRQKPIYQKKLDVWLEQPFFLDREDDEERKKNIERNRMLIDLSNVPEDIEDRVVSQYNSNQPGKGSDILPYLSKYNLGTLLENIREF